MRTYSPFPVGKLSQTFPQGFLGPCHNSDEGSIGSSLTHRPFSEASTSSSAPQAWDCPHRLSTLVSTASAASMRAPKYHHTTHTMHAPKCAVQPMAKLAATALMLRTNTKSKHQSGQCYSRSVPYIAWFILDTSKPCMSRSRCHSICIQAGHAAAQVHGPKNQCTLRRMELVI
jgi:hypothetical protein